MLEQSIPVGEKVAAGITAIDLIISGGLEGEVTGDYMYMIDVTKKDLETALTLIGGFNFSLNIYTEYIANDEYPAGVVVSTDPEVRTRIGKGAEVTIYVSAGPATLVPVPNLIGMSADEAKSALAKVKLKLGNTSYEYSNSMIQDRICYQSVTAGSTAPEGASIDIHISRGPQPDDYIPIPDVNSQNGGGTN